MTLSPADDQFGIPEKKTERKSFFRRLAERKGSPAIDWEEVLNCKKPLDFVSKT